MQENQTLRNLLRSLSAFVGDGAGGLLHTLGWSMTDFNNFVNRSETDTAWESYQSRKLSKAVTSDPLPSKRVAEDGLGVAAVKRLRHMNEHDKEGVNGVPGYTSLVSLDPQVP